MDPECKERQLKTIDWLMMWNPIEFEEKILVHTVKKGEGVYKITYKYGELYSTDLKTGKVNKFGGGKLFDDDGNGTLVTVGNVIYVLGVLDPDRFTPRDGINRDPAKGFAKDTRDPEGIGYILTYDESEGLMHRRASCLDLSKVDDKWKKVPPMKSRDLFMPCCTSLGHKIYLFGGTQSFLEVFDTQTFQWDHDVQLSLPPQLDDHKGKLEVSYPVISDSFRERIILHIKGLSSLFAYYPVSKTLECLVDGMFYGWSTCVALSQRVLYIHIEDCPESPFLAYHIDVKKWLNVVWSARFDNHDYVVGDRYRSLVNVGLGNLCLADCSPDRNSPDTNNMSSSNSRSGRPVKLK